MSDYAQRYLDRFSTALIADSAFRTGAALEVASPGLTVIDPAVMVAGPVVTVEANNDLVSILEAVHGASRGEVIVISSSGSPAGLMGDLIGTEAIRKSLGGFVVDGLVRDRAELIRLGVPVACRGTYPVGPLKVSTDGIATGVVGLTVQIGEATVRPGMWAFADSDGVVFLHEGDLNAVFDAAASALAREEALAAEIEGGLALGDIFDLDAFLEARAEDPTLSFNDHLKRLGGAI